MLNPVDVGMSAGGALCCAPGLLEQDKRFTMNYIVYPSIPLSVEELPDLHEVLAPTFVTRKNDLKEHPSVRRSRLGFLPSQSTSSHLDLDSEIPIYHHISPVFHSIPMYSPCMLAQMPFLQ